MNIVHKEGRQLSLIVVNFNAGAYLQACITSVKNDCDQILVVDNASTDNSSVELRRKFYDLEKLQLIENAENLGFSKACNIGIKNATGNFLFFLNPDCVVAPGAISRLMQTLEDRKDVGMVGGLITFPDGREQAGGRRAIPTPWRSFVRASHLSSLATRYPRLFSDFLLHREPLPDHAVEVEAISGACMMVRREALADVGLLDEGYFMHCEDLDWCMRFRLRDWKILFVPDAQVMHHKGGSSGSRPIFIEWHKHKGMVRFYRKFFRHQYPNILMPLVVVGVWTRFVAKAIWISLRKIRHKPEPPL